MPDRNPNLEQLVDRCGQLYSLPTVAIRVLALTESPTVDARALKDCIENDPALTSKILRVVNSSLFGLSREVTDLTQAIGLLGINPLKLLVLGFSLPDRLFVGINGAMLRRYWHRTLVKAVAAREISQTLLDRTGDEAFIAGLLQDIGALVLLQELGERYARLYGDALATSADISATEREALGFDHATLSARLLERWRLPRQLAVAVEAGHSRQQVARLAPGHRPLAEVLLLADFVAALLAENRTDGLSELLDCGHEFLALGHAQLASLVSTLSAKVHHLADVLEIDLPAGQDYQAILIEAHGRMSELVCDATAQLLAKQTTAIGDESIHHLPEVAVQSATATATTARRAMLEDEGSAMSSSGNVSAASALAPPPERVYQAQPAADGSQNGSRIHAGAGETKFHTAIKDGDSERDPGFVGRLTAAVATCRQARCSLSLLIVEIDQYDDIILARGPRAAGRIVAALEADCRSLDHREAAVSQSGEVQFTIILPDCDRRQAVDLANELIARVQRRPHSAPATDAAVLTISIGVASVALPPKNFPAADLIRAAERCLNGAKLSGGNAAKSIEIY
jgi:diguanylate cyclase (GGDEF)-like protein